MKWDLAQLYSQLNLRPDCTLEEFNHAYRRRIAELHPDKGPDAATPEARLLLPELIWLYGAATRFYRRYGRLPGAVVSRNLTEGSQATRMPLSSGATGSVDPPPATSRSSRSDDVHETPLPRAAAWAILLLVLLLIVTFLWGWLSPKAQEESGSTARNAPDGAMAIANGYLELGMDQATVIAIQGEPMLVRNPRWDYGPSWIEFEQGRLVDWYSSPLYPLKTTTPSPVSERSRSVE
jgi:hypothetical protein